MSKKYDLASMSRTEVAAYIDEQALPFIRMNEKAVAAGREAPFLNPRAEAIRYKLVKRPDGSIVKRERRNPLLVEVGEVSKYFATGRVASTDGERVLRQKNSGKYNDESRLMFSTPVSVEVGEVADFRRF